MVWNDLAIKGPWFDRRAWKNEKLKKIYRSLGLNAAYLAGHQHDLSNEHTRGARMNSHLTKDLLAYGKLSAANVVDAEERCDAVNDEQSKRTIMHHHASQVADQVEL
jgi:hypothetical protein